MVLFRIEINLKLVHREKMGGEISTQIGEKNQRFDDVAF